MTARTLTKLSQALRALADAIEELPTAAPSRGPSVLRYETVAARLGISVSTARKRGRRGVWREVIEGGHPGVLADEFEAYICNLPMRGGVRARGPREVKRGARPMHALITAVR